DVGADARDGDPEHAGPGARLARLVLEEVDELVGVAGRVVARAAVEAREAAAVGRRSARADGLLRRSDAGHVLARGRGERVGAGARDRLGGDLAGALDASGGLRARSASAG